MGFCRGACDSYTHIAHGLDLLAGAVAFGQVNRGINLLPKAARMTRSL
jgi:hypothetical protein